MKNRPTIKDIARRAGISKSTVSRVIAGDGQSVSAEARKKVMDAIQELGYVRNVVASSMRTSQTQTVLLAIPDITNPFWPEVARGVQDEMATEDYAVVFANSDWNPRREQRNLELAQRNRFDGVLINPVGVSNDLLRKLGIPVVLLGIVSGFDFDMVGTNSQAGAETALRYLVSLGHTRIGLILGQREGRADTQRLPLYMQLLDQLGLEKNEEHITVVPFKKEEGQAAMGRILSTENPPSAVFCENDILALGALQAARECGVRVPADVSVIGMDNIDASATTSPPLTTISKPKYEIGRQAARFLLERLRDDTCGAPRSMSISSNLVVRETTAVWQT